MGWNMNKKLKLLLSFLIIIISIFLIILKYNNNKIDSSNNKTNNKVSDKQENKKEDNFIKTEDSDIIGSIKIIGTNIDNVIVQGNDNDYYMNRDEFKKYSKVGSIFLDYRNQIGDRKLLIYGHNSRTLKDAPFHDLEKFLDDSFYKKHHNIELTLNGEKATYEIFSIMVVKSKKYPHTIIDFNDSNWLTHLTWMKNQSLYDTGVNIDENDEIITLQTCYYEPADSFLLVNAKKI